MPKYIETHCAVTCYIRDRSARSAIGSGRREVTLTVDGTRSYYEVWCGDDGTQTRNAWLRGSRERKICAPRESVFEIDAPGGGYPPISFVWSLCKRVEERTLDGPSSQTGSMVVAWKQKGATTHRRNPLLFKVAGVGFEPTTFGL